MTAFFTVTTLSFHTALSRVALAANEKDNLVPELGYIACVIKDKKLHMWATDRYRLHYEVIAVEYEDMADGKLFYIPAKAAKDLKSLGWNKRDAAQTATIHFDEHMVSFGRDFSGNITMDIAEEFARLPHVIGLLKTALEEKQDTSKNRPDFTALNPKYIADLDKVARMNPFSTHKAQALVIEAVPGGNGKVLVQLAGIEDSFIAVLMSIRLDRNGAIEPVNSEEILESLPAID